MTPYKRVFDAFEGKITDYELKDLIENIRIEIEIMFLNSAVTNFVDCTQDLIDRNDTLEQFNITLTDLEIEILSLLMVKQWTSQFKNTTDLLETVLSPDSFKRFSPANQIKAIRELYNDTTTESDILISKYTFNSDFIGGLG